MFCFHIEQFLLFSRANNARSKAYSAEIYAKQARGDSLEARVSARAAAPDFRQPGNYIKKKERSKNIILLFPGEEKPQAFIPLDIDRQVDGKLVITNHINIGPPNGRLPMPSNFSPDTSMSLPPHQTNSIASYKLDGGVYQGQPPSRQPNDWNQNTKVKLFSLIYLLEVLFSNSDYWITIVYSPTS